MSSLSTLRRRRNACAGTSIARQASQPGPMVVRAPRTSFCRRRKYAIHARSRSAVVPALLQVIPGAPSDQWRQQLRSRWATCIGGIAGRVHSISLLPPRSHPPLYRSILHPSLLIPRVDFGIHFSIPIIRGNGCIRSVFSTSARSSPCRQRQPAKHHGHPLQARSPGGQMRFGAGADSHGTSSSSAAHAQGTPVANSSSGTDAVDGDSSSSFLRLARRPRALSATTHSHGARLV
ncbi:hypothetical protein V8E36_001926 [Tilletia maclaganii]